MPQQRHQDRWSSQAQHLTPLPRSAPILLSVSKAPPPKSDADRATELRLARGDAAGCAFEDVVFAYASRPDLRVLDGLTLRIPAKSRSALVGPSGGGKTTLLHLLERFYDVGSGRILFDGVDIRAVEPTV